MYKAYITALSQYGTTEIVGKKDNPEVLKYFNEIGFSHLNLKDETAWCSAFVNWCFAVNRLPFTARLNATSWLDWGNEVDPPENARGGDVVVFWRGKKKGEKIAGTDLMKGHVGFFVNYDPDGKSINVLGGNQGNKVQIIKYPISKLLGIRRL